jgi:hypothetical protein
LLALPGAAVDVGPVVGGHGTFSLW